MLQLKSNNIGSGLIGPVDLTSLTSTDFLPREVGRTGPELAICQMVVSAFVEAQQTVNARIKTLQDEIDSHKQHINTLKRELTAACKRQFDDQVGSSYLLGK